MKRTFVQDPVTRKFVEKQYYRPVLHYVQGDVQPFISPVDGSIVNSKSGLRNHNAKNNVVNYEEFGDAHFEKKQKERDDFYQGKTGGKERLNDIVRAYNEHEEKARRR